ncbi:LytR/AlgR family response regulator transcription factor [Clostridium omnivorum]|uniref:Stage 0 sporulation protein A homolog n=1 Tax=Clostridium omnivorum TaxID=1604902 RepID=A0ABQ5N624_9CLOT|nr:LytTR family DNA-binding domain-containing protein [Clostridium sp. E14]GLC30689.1 sensory transduction protein LytT [Clostridium sp. E14]
MANILIVEDDIYQRRNLIAMIKELGESYQIFEADCEEAALKLADENRMDLFYVDIELKDSSGLEFAKKIRSNNMYKLTWIVFMTTYVKYMLEAFKEIHCYDYIIKPYDKEKVKELTLLLLNNRENEKVNKLEKKYIIFKSRGIEIKQYIEDIFFIEICLRTIILHTKIGKIEVNNLALNKIKGMLNGTNIIQCHRSYLVNIDYVQKVDKTKSTWDAFFRDYNMKVPVSRSYKKDFEETLKNAGDNVLRRGQNNL